MPKELDHFITTFKGQRRCIVARMAMHFAFLTLCKIYTYNEYLSEVPDDFHMNFQYAEVSFPNVINIFSQSSITLRSYESVNLAR